MMIKSNNGREGMLVYIPQYKNEKSCQSNILKLDSWMNKILQHINKNSSDETITATWLLNFFLQDLATTLIKMQIASFLPKQSV